jgi:hypothetical protein
MNSQNFQLSYVARQSVVIWGVLTTASLLFGVLAASFVSVGVWEAGAVLIAIVLTLGTEVVWILRLVSQPETLRNGLPWTRGWGRHKPFLVKLLNRLYVTVSGAEGVDILVDMLRVFGIVMLSAVALGHFSYPQHTWRPEPAAQVLTGVSLSLIIVHLVYPLFRKPSKWEFEYRYRKILMATALNSASECLTASDEQTLKRTVESIENTILPAVKSYLEFVVSDRSGQNISANLIVRLRSEPSKLLCVARTDPKRPVPTVYEAGSTTLMMKSLQQEQPVYISDFLSRRGKKYRMVWHIPILLRDKEGEKFAAGLLAIDSLIPGHLDFLDQRETLLLHLTPYLSVLRFTLQMRQQNRVLQAIRSQAVIEKLESVFQTQYEVDRNVDLESLDVAIANNSVLDREQALKNIVEEMQALSIPRRFFATLFPYVEANSRSMRI